MQAVNDLLRRRFADAIRAAFGPDAAGGTPAVQRCKDPRFGDYQFNGALALAKARGAKPRDLAQRIADKLNVADVCDPPQIAGPGFINLVLKPEFVAGALADIPPAKRDAADRVGIDAVSDPIVVVVDMSSPNLAKEMHVGHLRSTVIGDCAARVLEFAGHTVHRVNHVGDWGTQFGMLLAYLRRTQPQVLDKPDELVIDDLESFYVAAKKLYDCDPEFAETSRKTVVDLQGGDPATRAIWKAFCDESLRHCHAVYEMLDVQLADRGESFYNDLLPEIVEKFRQAGLAEESEGAVCVFLGDDFTTRDGAPLPMIIQKSDGGYNYDTTDLAAVYHRIEKLGARRLIYVVGVPQKQHFDMLFAAARKIGWAGQDVTLEHLAFGSMLGADSRPFKTRTGGTVKLKELLNEAIERARNIVVEGAQQDERRAALSEQQIADIAAAVGIGAIKYFDLSHSLAADYKFDFSTMLAMEGNTGPYMQYAYARIRSIGRKAGIAFEELPPEAPIVLEHESELRLAKTILRFGEIIEQLTDDLRPNLLTEYLFDLSKAFSMFYDRRHGVRVIDAEPRALRLSRLRLCDLTARTLKLGLGLLGIKTVEQM